MPIKNYTTSVPAGKSAAKVQQLLARRGARRMQLHFDAEGNPMGLDFLLDLGKRGEWAYRLPVRWEGVQAALEADGAPPRFRGDDHALRVAWRIGLDWLEAQLALIDAGAAELEEVMLPYLIMPGGETAYRWIAGHQRQLAEGRAVPLLESGDDAS